LEAQVGTGGQIAFNAATFILDVSNVLCCRLLLGSVGSAALPTFLLIATGLLYASNTVLVTGVLCLAERKPMRDMWQLCYFWSFPYYLVGAAASGLMIATARGLGWPFTFLVLPLLIMVYVSYRLHVTIKATAPVGA
jgi:hypothetical protein